MHFMRPLMNTSILTALAMIAFAGNSLLCRMAFVHTDIDPATFTSVRLLAGALVLWLIVAAKDRIGFAGSWYSALALFAYAAAFSFAYVRLSASTGALLLFGAVQVTMIGMGLWKGERLRGVQLLGLIMAFGGLVALLLPGLAAPPPGAAMLMLCAGMAWGIYSLRAKGAANPVGVTAGNFIRTVPFAAGLSIATLSQANPDAEGLVYAVASGGLASALGYVIWYRALRSLNATKAATVQLSVPVITALAAIVLLGESMTLRFVLASAAVLGGIALITLARDLRQ
jgi:drug/metabolite transporter (DMT)-like permease